MKKGDKVIVIRSIAGDTSLVGKKGVIYKLHTLTTGRIKVTVHLENGSFYHLDDTEIELITS